MASHLACQKVYYLSYDLHLDFHLLKDVFFTSHNLLCLLLAILASFVVPSSLRLQEYWTRLQTLSLKMPKEKKYPTSQGLPEFFFLKLNLKLKTMPIL